MQQPLHRQTVCHLPHLLFIDFNPKPGKLRAQYIPVLVFEHTLIHKIIQQIGTFIIMDPQALLLDKCILGAEVKL